MKRDQFISSATPVEVAHNIFDSADRSLSVESFMGAARDAVIFDLIEGKKVDRFRLIDVLDSALNDSYSVELCNVADLLLADSDERESFKERIVTAFVDRNVKLIEDRAQDLAEQAEEDAAGDE